jgi:hypothetical protein
LYTYTGHVHRPQVDVRPHTPAVLILRGHEVDSVQLELSDVDHRVGSLIDGGSPDPGVLQRPLAHYTVMANAGPLALHESFI